MAGIVVVGSLNMDLTVKVKCLPSRFETVMGRDFQTTPGGKGANQAVAAARLGASVAMIGRVGEDAYGANLLANLANSGVDVSGVVADPEAPTGIALITVDDAGANTIVVVPGANSKCSPRDVEARSGSIGHAKAVVAQLEVETDTVVAAFRAARAEGVATVLNPAPAPHSPLPRALLEHADFIIPNEVEAGALSGMRVSCPDEALEAARVLHTLGPERVIITLGSQGSVFAGPEGEIRMPAYRVNAIDSTAAGDAFIGAFTVALIDGMSIRDCLAFGSAAGALAASKPGAQASLPCLADVAALSRNPPSG
ncbi:MAG: ribokinase [Firmicutes bacterium]|nr:ribokinase [Bacillota bacterium]